RSFPADLVEDILGDVNGDVGGDGQGNGIAGAAVHLDQLAVVPNAELGVVGVVAQLADVDIADFAAELLDDVGDEVVRQGPRRRQALDAAVDAGCLEDADHDGETALAVHLLEHDDLLLVDLADDDPLQLHVNGHGGLAFPAGRDGAGRARFHPEGPEIRPVLRLPNTRGIIVVLDKTGQATEAAAPAGRGGSRRRGGAQNLAAGTGKSLARRYD